jgi:hypothetical protein
MYSLMRSTSSGPFSLVLLVVVALFLAGGSVSAQTPTPTPSPQPTATPYMTPTPSFWIGDIPIILPTAFLPPLRTPIYIPYTPAPNLNPLGLPNIGGDLFVETVNMRRAIEDVLGPFRGFLYAMWVFMMGFGIAVILYRMARKKEASPSVRIRGGYLDGVGSRSRRRRS